MSRNSYLARLGTEINWRYKPENASCVIVSGAGRDRLGSSILGPPIWGPCILLFSSSLPARVRYFPCFQHRWVNASTFTTSLWLGRNFLRPAIQTVWPANNYFWACLFSTVVIRHRGFKNFRNGIQNCSWTTIVHFLLTGVFHGQDRWFFVIGDLHDRFIWLQLPESFTFSLSYAN